MPSSRSSRIKGTWGQPEGPSLEILFSPGPVLRSSFPCLLKICLVPAFNPTGCFTLAQKEWSWNMTDFLPMFSTFICRGQLCNLQFGGVLEDWAYNWRKEFYIFLDFSTSAVSTIWAGPSFVMVLCTQWERVQPCHCSLPTRCQYCPLFLVCDCQGCPQTLPDGPWGENLPPVENHCCSPTFSPINGCSSHDTFFSLHFLSFLYLIMF